MYIKIENVNKQIIRNKIKFVTIPKIPATIPY